MNQWNPSADNADDTPFDAELHGSRIHADDAVPEKDGLHQNEKKQAYQAADDIAGSGAVRPQEKRIQDNKKGLGNDRGEEELQQRRAVLQNLVSAAENP